MRRVMSEQSQVKKQIRTHRDGDDFSPYLNDSNSNSRGSSPSGLQHGGGSSPLAIDSGRSRRRDSVSSSSTTTTEEDEDEFDISEDVDEIRMLGSSIGGGSVGGGGGGGDNNNEVGSRDLESIKDSLRDLEAELRAQRTMKGGRPYDLEAMTSEQLMQEKEDLHSALLRFEATFGQPETAEEKDLTRDIYDRYRTVKRLVRRSSLVSLRI